jgi:TonB family protein
MSQNPWQALLTAFTALCIAACGGSISSDARGIVPGTALRRDGRPCGLAAVPESLPSTHSVVDSIALGHLAEVSATSLDLVYALRFSPQGRLTGLTLVEPAAGTPLAPPYRDLISRTILTQPPQEGVWGLRLRIRAGENSAITVQRSEFCAPEPLRTGVPGPRSTETIMTPEDMQNLRNARPCRLLLQVNENGMVRSVDVVQSSGSEIVDRNAVESWRGRRFDPATLDGTPVPGTYEATVRLQIR